MKVAIETKDGDKGRSFSVDLTAWVHADELHSVGGTQSAHRPVWLLLLGTDTAIRATRASLQKGRNLLKVPGGCNTSVDRYQICKSAKYAYTVTKYAAGSALLVHQPDLFAIDPGMVDKKEAEFVMIPPRGWEGSEALLFLSYLDRRSYYPYPPGLEFAGRVLAACLDRGLAARPSYSCYRNYGQKGLIYVCEGFARVGLDPDRVIAFKASHAEIGDLLKSCIEG